MSSIRIWWLLIGLYFCGVIAGEIDSGWWPTILPVTLSVLLIWRIYKEYAKLKGDT
jgi:hypothetical protein